MNENTRPTARSIQQVQVGERIRLARIAHGLTQETVANVLGRTKSQVSEIERGQTKLNYNDILSLDSLGLHPGYIICNRLSDLQGKIQERVIEAKKQGYVRVPSKWKPNL